MEKPARENQGRYNWKADLIALAIASLVAAFFVYEWASWTSAQIGA